jgi:lipopolysaccharide export system protein LptA
MTSCLRGVLSCLAACILSAALGAAEPADTVITAESFESRSTPAQTVSVFSGNVSVAGNDIKITCDRLEVVSLRGGDKTDVIGRQERFKSMLATGRVHIVQGDREATCERAEVLPGEDKVILTGRPTVVDHGNNSTATGDPLILYRGQRRVEGTNVRITLPPLKDLGFDKNQAPPAPTPP